MPFLWYKDKKKRIEYINLIPIDEKHKTCPSENISISKNDFFKSKKNSLSKLWGLL